MKKLLLASLTLNACLFVGLLFRAGLATADTANSTSACGDVNGDREVDFHTPEKEGTVVYSGLTPETARPYFSKFSSKVREKLENVVYEEQFEGVISATVVEKVLQLEDGRPTIQELMMNLLPLARLYALPATSGFRVGAVCRGESGALYFGANLEIGGEALGFTIHAEQSAIVNALVHGEQAVRRLAVTASPCGHCRQFLNELVAAPDLKVMVVGRSQTVLRTLLPDSFGPQDLGVEGALLAHADFELEIKLEGADDASSAALKAARRSYAPYTKSPSGVAVQTEDGQIVAGPYVENAAYNPSIPPLLSALNRLRFRGQRLNDIRAATLVEGEGAKISQCGVTRSILQAIAPGAELRVVQAKRIGK